MYQRTMEAILKSGLRESLCEFDVKGTAEAELARSKKPWKTCRAGRKESYGKKLQKELRGKIDEGILIELMNDYMDEHEDEYMDIENGNQDGTEGKEGFWDVFWESCDEKMQEVYLERKELPMYGIISEINERCKEDSLDDLLRKLPKKSFQMMESALKASMDRCDFFPCLKWLQNFLLRWDREEHDIMFEDLESFLERAGDLCSKNEEFIELFNLSNDIRRESRWDGITGKKWQSSDANLYGRLRKCLQNLSLVSAPDGNGSGNGRKTAGMDLNDLGKTFDVAIDLESEERFEDAVMVGVVVQIVKKIQNLYLYQVIMRKYESGYGNSSVRLEKMKAGSQTEGDADENTYYYALFLTMKKILQKGEAGGAGNEAVLKDFLEQAVSENRNQYLTKLFNEVTNGSETD